MRTPLYILLILAALSCLPQVQADDGLAVHGVFTQGMFTTSDNNMYGETDDDVSFDYTQASINLSIRPLAKLRFSGQFIYQDVGGFKDSEFDTDYLFADWQFFSGLDATAGLRIGRFKNPYGLYNETSDIIFTRPSILLPQSVYPEWGRNVLLSSDGLFLYSDFFTDAGEYHVYLGVGKPRVDESPRVPVFDASFSGEISEERAFLAGANFESSTGAWKVGITSFYADSKYELNPSSLPADLIAANLASTPLPPGITLDQLLASAQIGEVELDIESLNVVVFAQFIYGDWIFTAENIWQYLGTDADPVPVQLFGNELSINPDMDIDVWSEGYYLQIEKHLGNNVTGFLRWDVRYEDRDDRSGKDYEANFGSPSHFAFGKDASVGMRWAISEQLMLNAELHVVDGTNWLPIPDSGRRAQHRYWNLGGLAISYRF